MPEKLFKPYKIGNLALANRVVMAPMTRSRADNPELVPNDLMVEYYKQRASAGLIITEGTWVNEEGIGFINVPGIYNKRQVEGWNKVTNAVHDAGGKIFSQIAHTGHYSHPDHLHGKPPISPSGVNPADKVFTPTGFKESVTPREMTIDDIKRTVEDHRVAAQNAKDADFDGIEIHGAAIYLIPSFLNSTFNKRTDRYGGSAENRARFLLEIIEATIPVWGPDKVGLKLSPISTSGGFAPTSDTEESYRYLIKKLNDYPLAYLHLLGNPSSDNPHHSDALKRPWVAYRKDYNGVIIAGGGFTRQTGEETLQSGEADLIAYGTPFVSNPDLVERFREGASLTPPIRELFYSGVGPTGYTDYPFLRQTE